MLIRFNKKHIFICLLICSLFLTSYLSVFNASGIITPNQNLFNTSSLSGGSESMNGIASPGHYGYMSNTDTSSILCSFRTSRWLDSKTGFNPLTAVLSAQLTSLIFTSSLSEKTSIPFNALQIVLFLHKKDGMK